MKLLTIIITLVLIVAVSFGFIPSLRQKSLDVSFAIKEFYLQKKEDITLFIQDYTNQAEQIRAMRDKIQSLEQEHIKYKALQTEFDNIHYTFDIERHYVDPDVSLVKVLSYVTLGSYTKIWLDYNKPADQPKIFGLIKDGFAIGVAYQKDKNLLGSLNGDLECSYSVLIGENRVPGTLRTIEDGSVIIDYIPAWQNIKEGDDVITSGLDGIFFEGVEVGKIGHVKSENGYLQAEIKLYGFSNRLSYVWLVDTKIPQVTTLSNATP